MSVVIAYLAGCATPFALLIGLMMYFEWEDWRAQRRYRRAWAKFSAEFRALTPGQLDFWRAKWRNEAYLYAEYNNDEARYFAMRWKHGHTTEV